MAILLFKGLSILVVTMFLQMIDHLLTTRQKMLETYDAVSGNLGFLSQMPSISGDQLSDAAERLVPLRCLHY